MNRAIFLDRDGTLNVERNYLADPDQLELIPGVPAALRRLQDAGFLLVVVTNQSGIGRGFYTEADVHRVHARLRELLVPHGVRLDRIYFAPEAPDRPSRGRKPSPQFLFDARDELGVDLACSYMIGDKPIDLECGRAAGVARSILVRTGYGAEAERQAGAALADVEVADDLAGAADLVLRRAAAPNVSRILGVIPARYASTRFPGKPLALIAGQPLIQRVVERCRRATALADVLVATDDARIAQVAGRFCRVEMTRTDHPSGTDRIAEVASRCACDAVVNVQGDEPLIDPAAIDAVARALVACPMSTAATSLSRPDDYDNPNVVKVVVNAAGRALYFSRRTIPFVRDAAGGSVAEQLAAFGFLKHLGLYGYRRGTLLDLVRHPVSALERAERLEQLRALDHGIPIAVVRVQSESVGVDAPEDVARVESLLAALGGRQL